MKTVHAVYENGVFRPVEPVALPDHCQVEFEPRIVNGHQPADAELEGVYEVLAARHASGERNVAERHDEHQP